MSEQLGKLFHVRNRARISGGAPLGPLEVSRPSIARCREPGVLPSRSSCLQMAVEAGDRVQKILPLYDGAFSLLQMTP
jgi:hypothetical protein